MSTWIKIALAAALGLAGVARAEEADELTEMGELDGLDLVALMDMKVQVVTASKIAQDIDDAPAVIEVLTADDLRRFGHRSVAEALRHVTGFYVLDDHILPNVSVRGVAGGLGSESGMIKVMIDGQPVAFRATAGNWLGVELIPLRAVSRIEIIRGPASALYGADAFLGVVNVITVSGEELDAVTARVSGAEANAGAGLDNFGLQYELVAGKKWGSLDILIGAGGETRDLGGLRLPATSPAQHTPARTSGDDASLGLAQEGLSLFAKATYSLLEDTLQLRASLAHAGIRRGGDFSHWSQLSEGLDAQNRRGGTLVSLEQYRATAALDYVPDPNFALRLSAAIFRGGPRGDDRIEVASDFFYVRRSFAFSGFTTAGEVFWSPHENIQLVAGSELIYDHELLPTHQKIDKSTGDVFDGSVAARGTTPLINPGAYLQADWRAVAKYLHVTSGLRYDHHNIYGSQLTGRAGIVSHWLEGLTTKILYGSAFKAPSPMLLFAEPLRPGDVIGNPQLAPQLVHTFELQAAWTPLRALEVTSGVAYSLLLDKAEFRPQGINVAAQNIAGQKVLSWETKISHRWRDRLAGYLSLDLQYGTRELGEEGYQAELIGSSNVVHPLWIVRGGVSAALPSLPLEVSLAAMFVGPRRASDSNIYERGQDYRLNELLLLNAGVQTEELDIFGWGDTRASVRAYNLLDSRVPDPGFAGIDYPRMPLEVMIELTHAH